MRFVFRSLCVGLFVSVVVERNVLTTMVTMSRWKAGLVKGLRSIGSKNSMVLSRLSDACHELDGDRFNPFAAIFVSGVVTTVWVVATVGVDIALRAA